MPALRLLAQYAEPAPYGTKIKITLLATAMVDALGGPAEFQPRFSFPTITTMLPNKNFRVLLPPGVWTDDTSMALCLAHSLARQNKFDPVDQMNAYVDWWKQGELSAIGKCFDIGATVSQALRTFSTYSRSRTNTPEQGLARIRSDLSDEEEFAGNGSLMRVIPIGLAYWRDEKLAAKYARLSSETTHPALMCQEACEVWTGAVVRIMQSTTAGDKLSKLSLFDYFATYSYQNTTLKEVLACATPSAMNDEKREEFYCAHHPIMQLVVKMERRSTNLPQVSELPSTGYVLDSLVAALYCFFATDSFEAGAISAVNLGSDADTVGVIYAGLAGCWYGSDEAAFWTNGVMGWRNSIVKRELVEQISEDLIRFSASLDKESNVDSASE